MQFQKKKIPSLLPYFSAGLFTFLPAALQAQPTSQPDSQQADQWLCRPDAEGWRCERRGGSEKNRATVGQGTAGDLVNARQARDQGESGNAARLDWRSREEMTAPQQAVLRAECCGGFVEPPAEGPEADADPEDSPLHLSGASSISQPESHRIQINGEVSLFQGYRSLHNTRQTLIDREADTIRLEGDVRFREPGILLTGSSALVDQGSEEHRIEDASYVLHEQGIHGQAGVIHYSSDSGRITVENGRLSRCEPGDEFWQLQAKSIELDTEAGQGRARAVTLRLKDVPVFYYPFTFPFPLGDQRMSGFLAPSAGSSSDGGIDIAAPYYFNIAPHHDATVTPRYIEERGAMASAELRYLGNWFRNTANLSYLGDDSLYDEELADVPGADSPPTDKRWFLGYEHEGRPAPNWSTRIDYNAVSDEDYFHDLGTRGLGVRSRTHLNREGLVAWQGESLNARARVQRIQLIDPAMANPDANIHRPFDRLPELDLGGDFGTAGPLRYGFGLNYVSFDRELRASLLNQQELVNGALVTGQRFTAEPHISLPLRSLSGFIVPTARYHYTAYELEDQAIGTDESPTRGIGSFSLDSGLIFERPVSLSGERFIQTLEPRLFYLYNEFEEQNHLPNFDTSELNFGFSQLFRHDRFSGGDRVADARQLSLAVTSRFLDDAGRERARASIGQIFYFDDRRVTLDSPLRRPRGGPPTDSSSSALVAEAGYSFSSNWRVLADLQWDPELEQIDEGRFQFSYQRDDFRILNLGWHYRRYQNNYWSPPADLDPRISQSDVSAMWPLNNNWRLLGRWNYDHSNNRNLESFAGVEYSNCCATVRLIGREWLDDDDYLRAENDQNRGIFVQLSLHGLGDLAGGGISSLLSEGIPGFKEYEN